MVAKINFTVQTSLVTQRTLNQISNASWRQTMEDYRKTELPKRFEGGPATEPGGEFQFAARSPKYLRIKKRNFPNAPALVRTNRLRHEVLRRSIVRATAKRGTIEIKAHFPLNSDRLRELTYITPAALAAAAEKHAERVTDAINDPKNHKKRIHKGKVATLG